MTPPTRKITRKRTRRRAMLPAPPPAKGLPRHPAASADLPEPVCAQCAGEMASLGLLYRIVLRCTHQDH